MVAFVGVEVFHVLGAEGEGGGGDGVGEVWGRGLSPIASVGSFKRWSQIVALCIYVDL